MISKQNIAGCVILYNSNYETYYCIESYIHQVSKLYLIDNSEVINEVLVKELLQYPHVEYSKNKDNCGVAFALNLAAQKAINDGYDFLLTMDDDTHLPKNTIEEMCSFLNKSLEKESIGIVSVSHSNNIVSQPYYKVAFTMTSGNLISLAIYNEIGGFNNNLFIDHVDHEYCVKLENSSKFVYEIDLLKPVHKLGEERFLNIGVLKKKWISHSPIRCYYFIRNGLWLISNYKRNTNIIKHIRVCLIKEILKNVFLEDEKIARIRYIIRGIRDYYGGKLGRYNGLL